ncbi:MAG TPA: SET domain-containing protein-lysine N-methyltransferase [Bryobacteraceae bacterium]|nr:SET domain-containing protein-lysine N-methyltransferase [Bryobacteraceae bacterium]
MSADAERVPGRRKAADVAPPPEINSKLAKFKLRVAYSPIHRWGIYAEEKIPKGRKIMEYTGEKINRKETKRRYSEREEVYFFTLNPYWTIDGAVGGSGAQYINHCCEPNCYSQIVKEHILYRAKRDILPGEELTIDYRFDKNVDRVECKCGAAGCRGTINLTE